MKTFLLAGALATLTTPLIATSTSAETLRLHSVWVESRPVADYVKYYADRVATHSNGDLEIQAFHGGTLGIKDPDILRILPSGAVDMSVLYPEYVARDEPEMAVAYVQGAITEVDEQLKAVPAIQQVYEPIFERWGIKTLGAIQVPERVVHIFCKEPVNTLEELKTKKLRVWGRHQVETFSRLGVSASIIPQSEMYVALQTGVVDCATYMGSVATTVSLQEVAPYGAPLHPHAGVPINILITQKRFDGLSEANQAALEAAAADTLEYTNKEFLSGEREDAGIQLLIDQGGQIIEPFSEADQATFTAAARDAWAAMSNEIGPQAVENMTAIQKAIEE
ncbi:TRAP transporter substrate-binding protein DctP [Rhodobacteraceae bacterium KMM 6894]|nr:TRAP transporter substrate-binding protein DctP [Rhodobacteraceae bacterium KMM 6894]